MSPLLDYSIAVVYDTAVKPELDSWETLRGDKLTLSGKETGILECKTPSSAILGVQLWPLRVYSSQQECPCLHLTMFLTFLGSIVLESNTRLF